jgi:hypothetical protein
VKAGLYSIKNKKGRADVKNQIGMLTHNNRVQRAVRDKVHSRGRVTATPFQVMRARALNELRPVADAKRYASARLNGIEYR